MSRIQVCKDPSQTESLLGALAPCLPNSTGFPLNLHLHTDLGGRVCDSLDGFVHAIRPSLGVGGLQQLGYARARMRADRWPAGATQLQLEVEL